MRSTMCMMGARGDNSSLLAGGRDAGAARRGTPIGPAQSPASPHDPPLLALAHHAPLKPSSPGLPPADLEGPKNGAEAMAAPVPTISRRCKRKKRELLAA